MKRPNLTKGKRYYSKGKINQAEMIGETKFYTCENTKDLVDVLNIAKDRTDGGLTVIELTGDYYFLKKGFDIYIDAKFRIYADGMEFCGKRDGSLEIRRIE